MAKTGSGLAKLEEDMRSKEQKRKDKEKRKELKKEKKKEKREKEKDRLKTSSEPTTTLDKKEKKDKERKDKDKDRKKSKDKDGGAPLVEGVIPKLTLKLHSSSAPPADSPKAHTHPSERIEVAPPPPRKITIKPIAHTEPPSSKKRTPSPELARFVPLVTRYVSCIP